MTGKAPGETVQGDACVPKLDGAVGYTGIYTHHDSAGAALTGVAQWAGRRLAKQKIASSIPTQGPCRRHPIDASLPLFLPPFPLSKSK